jgi:aspartyl-tRNA(Asn)/glutamyl-tRNA(Gln) amidotransferase subunit A
MDLAGAQNRGSVFAAHGPDARQGSGVNSQTSIMPVRGFDSASVPCGRGTGGRAGTGREICCRMASVRSGPGPRRLFFGNNAMLPISDTRGEKVRTTMKAEELCFTPATELAKMIRARTISPVELMRTTIERAERLKPRLNALCTITYDAAMAAAREAEKAVTTGGRELGPLHGIPITIKDLAFTRGVRTMAGSHVFRDRITDFDHLHVERLREAGAISIGKTTVSEFGWTGVSRSPLTGITHNPWKQGMNAGASSAGAGACAAAGIGPIHQGSDGAGSIRMPAAFCGVYGLKPSYGRVPQWPMTANGLISHVGPITRTVGDAALMLQAMAGPDDRDMTSLEAAPADFLQRLDDGIPGLKVAYSPDLGYLKVDTEVAEPVRRAVAAFEELGCRVEEVNPGWENPIEMEHLLYSANYASRFGPLLDEWADRMDPGLVALIRHGQTFSAEEYCRAEGERLVFYDKVRALFDRYDLLLTPTVSVAAFPAERLIPQHWEQHPWDWIRWAGFSYPFNLSWMPAATCPCGFTPAGLPVGLQIVAGRHRDLRVLQASRAFERARPWAQHRPPV